MIFNINNVISLSDFIPLYKFDSMNIKNIEHTMYINKNRIYAFSHFKYNDKECLLVKFDKNTNFPEYTVCKEDNPVAFNELFMRLPDKLPKVGDTTR
jgi:hypothetical protein